KPAPTPPPRAEPDIRVITLGPDGRPVPASTASTAPTPLYYGDDYGDTSSVHLGVTPELHVVRTGDTLWDISWYYFNDPWQWPRVWSYNAQISNPHWIYPGDLVRLLPRGQYTNIAGSDGGPAAVDTTPAPIRRSSVTLHDYAFVDAEDLKQATLVDG